MLPHTEDLGEYRHPYIANTLHSSQTEEIEGAQSLYLSLG